MDEGTLEQINSHINLPITKDEIFKCVRKLKNEKASGEDEIINEYIKSTVNQFINVYEKLFNVIFDNGIMPSSWLIGMIKPIYKNKGDKFDPKNYRPITIVSCLGKLFTAILNERLTEFSESFFVLSENQSGFRKGYSTLDNMFTLQSFFEILKCKKKKMYCAFVDFMKAFDTVWRAGLWHNMLLNNINGKMYDVIFNMYCNIKSCIVFNKCKSDYFACDNGVRQGENLSPFLFSLFLNDLETFLEAKNVTGLESISGDLENLLNIYLKLFIILYADDTVILSESIKTFDFSTLYTTLPHDKLKTRLKETIHKAFSHRNYGSKCVVLGYNSTYFSNKIHKGKTCYSEEQVISMLEFLIDNIFVSFGGTLFQQVVGIPMGTNCAPLLADLFLYSYESEFLQKLVKDKKIHEARAFNFTYKYIDDVLSINNSRFAEFLPLIYPPELEVKETTDTASSASFLDLYLEFDDSGQLSTKIYDKRDDFNFKIINFPNMCSNIPASPAYGVYISQLIRYARASSNYSDFLKRHLHLRNRLLDQGYKKIRLIRSL